TSDLRELAANMYLLLILRFLLGLVPGVGAVRRQLRIDQAVFHRRRSIHASVLPHEWMSMAYILVESSRLRGRPGRATFTRANHPVRSVFRFVGRWPRCGELCPVFAARQSVHGPRSRCS